MSDLNNLMNTSGNSDPILVHSLQQQQQLGQQSADVGSVGTVADIVNNNTGPVLNYNELNCQTLSYNQNNQLLNTLIAENSYKTDDICLTDRQPTELTFSDLTQPVPNVSTLESNRLLSIDSNLPTVDGVSGAVPEPKSVLSLQQMNSLSSEPPSIEIPTNDTMVPQMAPKDNQSLMAGVSDSQYTNIFQPIINGPSGSAPQTPAPSPIATMDTSVQNVQTVMSSEAGVVDSQQMPVMTTFDSNSGQFPDTNVANDVYNVPINQINQMVPVMSNSNVPTVPTDGPLTLLGVEPALQEQLLDAIPPPSVNFPPGPVPTDEKGIPSALPGEFPLSLPAVEEEKVGGIESASVPLDKIEATIDMNAKPIPTLTDAVPGCQSDVNIIKSLPQSPQQSTGPHLNVTGQQEFNLKQEFYANQLQTGAEQSVYSQTTANQLTGQQQSNQSAQHTSTALQQSIPQTHSLQTLTTLQPSQSILNPVSHSQSVVSTSLVNVPEVQLPPPPAPPSATSIGVFETNPNGLMSDIVTQNQLTNVLPPPPPLQPVVQSANQSGLNQLPEMNTLTNLVPVVEPSDPSLRQPLCVVIKSEPQFTETDNNCDKVNDDNNNPILHNCTNRDKQQNTGSIAHQPPLMTAMRGFPLCVISTTPTPYVSKNKTIVTPKCELTLPPKKAKYTSQGLLTLTAQPPTMSQPLKSLSTSQAVPSTGMLYDLPHHTSEQSSNSSPTYRVQSGHPLTQPLKLPHNMTPPFTTVSPILLSNLMPAVSVIDSPLSLVKDEKMRQLIGNHPDYPAISGLLSFISPYHKSLTTSTVATGHQPQIGAEVPLSLSVKTNLNTTPVTANSLSHSHPSSHVPSLTRPSVHMNQSITSASNIVHTQPTAVPVSVVTSVVDHNRGFLQRVKSVGQNSTKNKINVEHNSTSQTGVKLQLAPLLSGDPAKPFQCALCGKHLASKNVYQLHLRSHSGEKPFTCNLCGHSFSQKTSLTRHMRSHTGERPFPCQVCGKRFADKERIKIHMRTHTGEKPFACDICGKQFSQKSTVKRHMSVHTGEKPFKCETCGKGFANRGNLTAHTKTHSNS